MALAKRVIVTGASSGIGRALCVEYARLGWQVGATARRSRLLDDLRREVEAGGGTLVAEAADAADRGGFGAAVARLAGSIGGVDLLVANAGLAEPSGGVEMNSAGVARMLAVNVMGVVWAFEAVLPGMLAAKSGHLVAVGSLAGLRGLPGAAGYCASKAAVRVYCEALRAELAPRGVAVPDPGASNAAGFPPARE